MQVSLPRITCQRSPRRRLDSFWASVVVDSSLSSLPRRRGGCLDLLFVSRREDPESFEPSSDALSLSVLRRRGG